MNNRKPTFAPPFIHIHDNVFILCSTCHNTFPHFRCWIWGRRILRNSLKITGLMGEWRFHEGEFQTVHRPQLHGFGEAPWPSLAS